MPAPRLHLRSARVEMSRTGSTDPGRLQVMPWPVAAVFGAAASCVCCWLVLASVAVMGWFQVPHIPLSEPLTLGTRWWVLAHGGPMVLSGTPLTVVPLTLTLACVAVATAIAGFAGKQARVNQPDELSQRRRRDLTLRVGGTFGAAYALCVLGAGFLVGEPASTARALVGAVVVGFGSGLWGAGRALGLRPFGWLPDWLSAVPRAVLVAELVMMACGAAVFVTALARHWTRVQALHAALAPGATGGVLLVVIQLAWLPNFLLWSASWALGAGFVIGTDTLVTPAVSQIGMVPALPVFGALPASGPPPATSYLWLLSGVVAGIAAAVMVVLARRRARFDETALAGGVSGVLAGLVWTLVTATGNGALGLQRLAEVGARLGPLAVMAPVVMGLSGVVAGAVIGLARRPHPDPEQDSVSDAGRSWEPAGTDH